MTELRAPRTFADAVTRVAGVIGWSEVARIVRRTERSVRYWSQPTCQTTPTMAQALALDEAHRDAGGQGAPFGDAYAFQLGEQVERHEACRRALANELADAAREAGEAQADAILVTLGGASPITTLRATRQVEEAVTAFSRLLKRLHSFLPSGAGPVAGSTGGPQS